MTNRKTRIYTAAFAVALFLIPSMILLVAGCGGGGGPINVVAGIATVQQKADNPVFPVASGHPGRIVFLTNEKLEGGTDAKNSIVAMDSNGGAKTMVVADHLFDQSTLTYQTPAISQDGFTVLFTTAYYATTTELMSIGVTGTNMSVVQRNYKAIQEPAISWDGTKIAFTAYSTKNVTAMIKPDEQSVSGESDSLLYFYGGGWKLSSSSTKSKGILFVDDNSACPATGYSSSIQLVIKERMTFSNHPLDKKYLCINLDDTNFILVEFTAFQYGWEKDVDATCTTNDQCGDFRCSSDGVCEMDSGTMTSTPCNNDGDCDNGTCNTDQLCIVDTGAQAYITFNWTWQQQTSPTTQSTTIYDVYSSGDRDGAGVVLLHSFDFKSYDLYTMDADGSNLKQHSLTANPDDPERYPCFSPLSSNYVYYSQGVIDTRYYDADIPKSASIYRLDITAETTEDVTTGTMDLQCNFSPGGSKIVYSKYNGTDFDIYLYDVSSAQSTLLANVCGPLDTTTCGDDMFPSFSPDGSMVTFQSDETTDFDIYRVNYDGSNVVNLTDNRNSNDIMPRWTP